MNDLTVRELELVIRYYRHVGSPNPDVDEFADVLDDGMGERMFVSFYDFRL